MKVYVLEGSIGSGKTTLLHRWADRARAAGAVVEGILAGPTDPKTNLRRVSLLTREAAACEFCSGGRPYEAATAEEGVVKVGKFLFFSEAFEQQCEILAKIAAKLEKCVKNAEHYMLIDEIGPLEIRRGMGLAPTLLSIVPRLPDTVSLVIVCRDSCVPDLPAFLRLPSDNFESFITSTPFLKYMQDEPIAFPINLQ